MADTKARGIIIFYMNVGMLPPIKAEAFIDRVKDRFMNGEKDRNWELPDDVGVFFVPIRENKTRVQYINFDN